MRSEHVQSTSLPISLCAFARNNLRLDVRFTQRRKAKLKAQKDKSGLWSLVERQWHNPRADHPAAHIDFELAAFNGGLDRNVSHPDVLL